MGVIVGVAVSVAVGGIVGVDVVVDVAVDVGVGVGVNVGLAVAVAVNVAVAEASVAVGNGVHVGNGVYVGNGVKVACGVNSGATLATTPAASVSTTPWLLAGEAVMITICGGTGVFVGLNSGRIGAAVGASGILVGTTVGTNSSSHPKDAPTASTEPEATIKIHLNTRPFGANIPSRFYCNLIRD